MPCRSVRNGHAVCSGISAPLERNMQPEKGSMLGQENVSLILIGILRAELVGFEDSTSVTLSADKLKDVYCLAKQHNAYTIVANYLIKHGFEEETLFNDFAVASQALQWCDESFVKVSKALSEARIEHLPLKGVVIRKEYPEPWMRLGGDIDILIHECDRLLVKQILAGLGYKYELNGEEDHYTDDSGVVFDIRVALGAPKGFCSQDVLSDVFNYAKRTEGYRLDLRDDMRYVHAIIHMAKHLVNGGCGISHVMDLWVLNHRISVTEEMQAAREALLEKKGVKKLEEAFVAVSEKWFSGADVSTVDGLEEFIINGLAHGSDLNHAIKSRREWGNSFYKLKRLFVPYDYLCQLFPQLKGNRWMTPIYEVYRWIYHIRNGRTKKIMREFNESNSISNETVEKTERMMKELFG